MKRSNCAVTLLLLLTLFTPACDTIEDVFRRGAESPSISNNPTDIIDRLLPEERTTRKRLRSVIEATMRVTQRERSEFRERVPIVRGILSGLTQKELQEIERILPGVEANPKLQWEDE